MANKRVEFWLDTLNYWLDEIDELGERYPDKMKKVHDYHAVIDDIYNHDKQGVIGKSLGDKVREATEGKKSVQDWRIEEDICDDYFSVEPSC